MIWTKDKTTKEMKKEMKMKRTMRTTKMKYRQCKSQREAALLKSQNAKTNDYDCDMIIF